MNPFSFFTETDFFNGQRKPRLTTLRNRQEEAYGNLLRNQGWLRSNCSRPLYQMPIPCRNTSCKPKRWNANVLGTAPRRLTPPTASRKPHSSISGSSSNPAKRRTSPFRHHRGVRRIVQDFRCRQESIVAQPDKKDTAYEKKEAPKLKHISRSELKRMTEIPMPDLMMELVRRVFILPR